MRNSSFKRPKMVLVFNGAQVLIAIVRSLHSAAELTKGNPQAISFCCTGRYICSGGWYFRYIHPDIEIELSDVDSLKLQEYDKMCGEKRRYYTVRKMARKRRILSDNEGSKDNSDGKPEERPAGNGKGQPYE